MTILLKDNKLINPHKACIAFCAECWIKLWVRLSKNWSCRAWSLHSSTKIQIVLRQNVFHLQIWAVSNTISWILCHCIALNCRKYGLKTRCILLMFTSNFETAVMRSAANTFQEVLWVVSLRCIVNPTWRPSHLKVHTRFLHGWGRNLQFKFMLQRKLSAFNRRLGVYKFLPFFFFIGAGIELFMIKVRVGRETFCKYFIWMMQSLLSPQSGSSVLDPSHTGRFDTTLKISQKNWPIMFYTIT